MFTFLLVVHALIAASLVTVILMQRSEGGGLGMGSGPAGLMTARGAADFLSRATAVLAGAFVLMAFLLATLAATRNAGGAIDTSLAGQSPTGPIAAPATPAAPTATIPMMGATTPAAPDPLTAQALAPAAAGLPKAIAPTIAAPPAKAPPSPEPEPKGTRHRQMTVDDLKHIDLGHAAPPTGPIGINGIGGGTKPAAPSSPPVAPVADKPAAATAGPPATVGNAQ